MAVHRHVNAVSYPAGSDLSAGQFRIVYMTDEGRIAFADGNGTSLLGILLNKPTAVGQAARVAVDGSVVKCEAGGAVNERDAVGAAAGGRGTAGVIDNAYIVGRALSAAAASADLFEVSVMVGRL